MMRKNGMASIGEARDKDGSIMLVLRRVATGVKSHFSVRASEWIMTYAAVGMYFAFQLQPNMFSISPSYMVLRSWANETVWGDIVLLCGLARLFALTINGTFDGFKYSPHLRLTASLIGICFWSQFSLGFIMAYMMDAGAFSAVVAYTTFCLAELVNMTRSWADISAQGKLRLKLPRLRRR